ncbi:MAG: 2-oxoacid:acceptor oxidoreductase family protein [Phycisphaerales bacterium]|nr:MAG: 2-oxoacid:acceptor oxidoreductase family protein [Phycisphaerales bacterium]
MQTEVIMSGFGGQGLMMIGKLLAYAGLEEGKSVTWLPSYGPEMRGGTANCTVVIGDKPIGSPLITTPRAAIVMNRPSLERFAPMLRKGGLLVIDSTLITVNSDRTDIRAFRIPADDIAQELGSRRSANLVMLGAYIGLEEVVSHKTLLKAIEKTFASKKQFLEVNRKTFTKGYQLAKAGKSDE